MALKQVSGEKASVVDLIRASASATRTNRLTVEQASAVKEVLDSNDAVGGSHADGFVNMRDLHRWLKKHRDYKFGFNKLADDIAEHFGRKSWSRK